MKMLTRIVGSLILVGLGLSAPAQTQPSSAGFAITRVDGTCFYRKPEDPAAAYTRPLTSGFTWLPASERIKCTTAKASIWYADPETAEDKLLPPNPFPVNTPTRISPPGAPARPPGSVDRIRPEDLEGGVDDGFRRAGRQRAAACPGSLSLMVPACSETIDIEKFRVQWQPPEGMTGRVRILLEPLDQSSGTSEILDTDALLEKGTFNDGSLVAFLRKIQRADGYVALKVVVEYSRDLSATRIVYVPTKQEEAALQAKMDAITTRNPLLAGIEKMGVLLSQMRFSEAADEAIGLHAQQPDSNDLQLYALVGLCYSGFSEKREMIRASLAAADIPGPCAVRSNSSSVAPVSRPPAPADPKTKRSGVALLIGNHAYPNDELDVVNNDLAGMNRVLTELGFQTILTRNLDTAAEFRQAVDTLLNLKPTANEFVLVYFSGHGMQLGTQTLLLGTKYASALEAASAAYSHAIVVDDVVRTLQATTARARIMIVDACRNNPFNRTATAAGGVALNPLTPNTFVMFANKPGQPAAARAENGLRSPFTEGLIYGFATANDGLKDVFGRAGSMTQQLNPGQVPEMVTSNRTDSVLDSSAGAVRVNPAEDQVAAACVFYRDHAWPAYLSAMRDAQSLNVAGADVALAGRLTKELSFAGSIVKAEQADRILSFAAAARNWDDAVKVFPGRSWPRLRAALSALMADDIAAAMKHLSLLSGSPDTALAEQAKSLWAELSKSFPAQTASTEPVPQWENAPQCPSQGKLQ